MITLRAYQQDMIDRLRGQLSEHQRVLLQAPTGAGKTALAVHMMGNAAARGRTSMFLVHQNELLKQTSAALWRQRLQHGMIAPNRARSMLPMQVASVQTLVRRLDRYSDPSLIIIDEAHRSVSATYQKIIAAYPSAYVVGLTATPRRTDGRGLDEIYSSLVPGPEIRWLIDHGWLCDYKLVSSALGINTSSLKTVGGDYSGAALAGITDKPTITGSAVAEYLRHTRGKRCVTMCVSIEHARNVAEAYKNAGVPAASIEGDMTSAEREKILEDFRDGRLKVITNVNLLVEGVDIPAIEVVQWLRATKSLVIWMQGNGRGLRPFVGKPFLIIMDHVNNWREHGLPDESRKWSLAPRKKGRGKSDDDEEPEISATQCDHCGDVFTRGPKVCPGCGHELPVMSRIPEETPGQLVEIERKEAIKQRRIEQGMARSIPELVVVGITRNFSKPAEWAAITFAKRARRKPIPSDFKEAREALAAIKLGRVIDDGSII